MAFSGGVMLVASFTSLILPSIDIGGAGVTIFGIITGFFVIYLIEWMTPHEEYILKFNRGNVEKEKLKGIFLIVSAIIIHNIPEGMAVGHIQYFQCFSSFWTFPRRWGNDICNGKRGISTGLQKQT